jgi:hypothetical protein
MPAEDGCSAVELFTMVYRARFYQRTQFQIGSEVETV